MYCRASSFNTLKHRFGLSRASYLKSNNCLTQRFHPDYGREVLNVSTLRSAITYVDISTGKLLETRELPKRYQKVSIRHLCHINNDTIAFAGQSQGPTWEHPPLIGLHRRGSPLELIELPTEAQRRLNGYIGSIECDNSGQFIMITSPRGHHALIVDVKPRQLVSQFHAQDVCATVALKESGSFLLLTGQGELLSTTDNHITDSKKTATHWDNHALAL